MVRVRVEREASSTSYRLLHGEREHVLLDLLVMFGRQRRLLGQVDLVGNIGFDEIRRGQHFRVALFDGVDDVEVTIEKHHRHFVPADFAAHDARLVERSIHRQNIRVPKQSDGEFRGDRIQLLVF